MHKIAQKVTSIALAASMLLSMFATNTVAFADEFTDSTTVSEDATEAPASGEVDAVESVDETDTDNPEAVDEPTETPEPTPSVTDVVDLTHDSTTDTVKDDTTGSEDVVLTDSDESEENTATPETAETFVGIQAVTPEYGDRITANVGDTVTLDALLNRDDVAGSGLMYAFVPSFYDGVNGVLTSVTGKQVGVPPVATSDDGGSTTPQTTTQTPAGTGENALDGVDLSGNVSIDFYATVRTADGREYKVPLSTANLSDGVLTSLLDGSGFTLTTNGQ